MTTVLVTGGAGFMGSHLVDCLIAETNFDVVVLDDLSGGFIANLNPKATFIQGSITDYQLVNKIFEKYKFKYVYHLAAYAAEGLSHFIKRFNYTNNLIGSVNLINASVNTGVECFVFTSSIAVYGSNQLPMTENLIPLPEDPYGVAKYAVEMELEVSHKMFGLNYIIFRPHNVYGERQNIGDKYRNVIGIFMNRIMRGEELIIFGDGEQRRAFSYIKDIIPSIARSTTIDAAMNKVFNIGADKDYSVNQLAQMVIEAMGLPASIKHVEERNEVKIAYADHTQFKRVFGAVDETPLNSALQTMAQWAKSVGSRKSKDFSDIEINKNMPAIWRKSEQRA